MVRTQRQTALVTLALLQVFTVTAGLAVATAGPGAALLPPAMARWPTVAAARPVLAAMSGTVAPPAASSGTASPGTSSGASTGASTGTVSPDPNGVPDALRPYLSDPALGGTVAAMVVDPSNGRTLLEQRAEVPATPASTAKIATAVAALASLGPDFRIGTRVVRETRGAGQGPPSGSPSGAPSGGPAGNSPGASPEGAPAAADAPVVLVGGGDPTLASPEGAAAVGYPKPAELGKLAKATVRSLTDAGITSTRVAYDDSLFTGASTGPGWKSNYVSEGNVAPVSALSIDGGRVDPSGRARSAVPAAAAAEAFADLLERGGIAVNGPVLPQRAAAGAAELAEVRSPPVAALVERMLGESDNDLAEALARQVALEEGQPASFSGGANAVRQVLGRLGVAQGVSLVDGSGLSTDDRLTVAALSRLLGLAASADHPALRSVVTGLPVAAFSGTLTDRYGRTKARSGAGLVRAKTGTLNGVSSLAGLVQTDDGRLLVFAFLADDVPTGGVFAAEAALDRTAAALADCGCG